MSAVYELMKLRPDEVRAMPLEERQRAAYALRSLRGIIFEPITVAAVDAIERRYERSIEEVRAYSLLLLDAATDPEDLYSTEINGWSYREVPKQDGHNYYEATKGDRRRAFSAWYQGLCWCSRTP